MPTQTTTGQKKRTSRNKLRIEGNAENWAENGEKILYHLVQIFTTLIPIWKVNEL